MDHVAYLNKQLKLELMIQNGFKTIESRWYKRPITPWNQVKEGDTIYFKSTGDPIKLKAKVAKVEQYNFKENNIEPFDLFLKYKTEIGILSNKINPKLEEQIKTANYGILIYLTSVETLSTPLYIPRSYGTAWLVAKYIKDIKIDDTKQENYSKQTSPFS